MPQDLKPTVQFSWNAGIQWQLTPQWFASATYVGSRIDNQMTSIELNPGT